MAKTKQTRPDLVRTNAPQAAEPENPLDPSPASEERIRERAYHLWEQDGGPHGQDLHYWERARELQGMEESAGAGLLPNPGDGAPELADVTVEDAAIQENLGELPHGGLSDQGDRRETPMARRK